jgi:hypothetical protein
MSFMWIVVDCVRDIDFKNMLHLPSAIREWREQMAVLLPFVTRLRSGPAAYRFPHLISVSAAETLKGELGSFA